MKSKGNNLEGIVTSYMYYNNTHSLLPIIYAIYIINFITIYKLITYVCVYIRVCAPKTDIFHFTPIHTPIKPFNLYILNLFIPNKSMNPYKESVFTSCATYLIMSMFINTNTKYNLILEVKIFLLFQLLWQMLLEDHAEKL